MAKAKVVANIARVAILFFAAALALLQAGLPSAIVTIAFASVIGAVAVGIAIAVGFGGQHLAGRLLESAVASLVDKKEERPSEGPR